MKKIKILSLFAIATVVVFGVTVGYAKAQVVVGTTTPGGCISGFVLDSSGNCIPTSPNLTMKMLSPNGGETLVPGQTYRIKWFGGTNNVDVYLLDNPTRLGKKIFSAIPNNGYVDWTVAPLASTDLYNYKTGSYNVPSGKYVMWVGCSDNNCTVDDSDSSFSIIPSTSSNLPPVITGGTYPVSLSVGQSGTWTVQASDPENQPLSYSVDWGDVPVPACQVGYPCATLASAIVQTSTFTHSYANAGTYTVKFTVKDSAGQTAQTSTTVQVGSVTQITASANIVPGTLSLIYDTSHQESSLSAPFSVTVTAGASDLTFVSGSFSGYSSGNGTQQAIGTADVYINKQTPVFPFVLKAGQKAEFYVIATANPLQMFAGYYSMSLNGIYATKNNGTEKEIFSLNSKNTNSVLIIGEKSPYISSVIPNPISSGQKMSISGQRLIGSMGMGNLYIDNLPSTVILDGSKDGTVLFFTLPTLTDGYHSLYVRDNVTGTGNSNNVSFQVQSTTTCYTFSNNLQIGSIGADVAALQRFLISKGFSISEADVSSDTARFGINTWNALKLYQKSINVPSLGYFGPQTRMVVNRGCDNTQSSITVLSPNGGETWAKGTTQNITWKDIITTPTYIIQTSYDIGLIPLTSACPIGQVCPIPATAVIVKSVFGSSYAWSVGKLGGGLTPDGNYSIQVCRSGTSICDASDSYFKITSDTTQPSITVLSPNGGESFSQNGIITGSFTTNLPVGTNYEIDLVSAAGTFDSWVYNGSTISADRQTFSFSIPTTALPGNMYKIRVSKKTDNCGGSIVCVQDLSDNYFTISSPTIPTPTCTISTPTVTGTGPYNISVPITLSGSTLGNFVLLRNGQEVDRDRAGNFPITDRSVPAGTYTYTVKGPGLGVIQCSPARTITVGAGTVTTPVTPPTPTTGAVTVLPWTFSTGKVGTFANSIFTGETLTYTLNWSGGPLDKSWRVFAHMVKDDGSYYFTGGDFIPTPTTDKWTGNTSTTNTITIPAGTPPGTYKVMVGLYNGVPRVTTLIAGPNVSTENPTQYRYQVGTITILAPINTQPASIWDSIKGLFGF